MFIQVGVVFSGQLVIARYTSESKTIAYMFYKSGCGLLWTASFITRAMARHTSESKTSIHVYKSGCGILWTASFTTRAMIRHTRESKTSIHVLYKWVWSSLDSLFYK